MNALNTLDINPAGNLHQPAIIRGTSGDDTLQGGPGNNVIDGGDGDDYILAEVGHNYLLGGAGNDSIMGSGTLVGGTGDDHLVATGNTGGDVFVYNAGDGADTLSTAAGGTLLFTQGVAATSVMLVRTDDDLSFDMGAGAQVTVRDWFKGPAHQLQRVTFADGTAWQASDIASMDIALLGGEGDDVLQGDAGNNLIHAGAGDDYVLDGEGNNIIYGGAGHDNLMGRGVLDGGLGNDTLLAVGDAEHNVYFFDTGDGRDTLYAQGDGNPGRAQGTVAFGEAIHPENLWFRQVGHDLAVDVVGSHEGMTIKDWYLDSPNQVARFMAGDDRLLTNDKVDALVQAMAEFAPPTSAGSGLDAAARDALAPVLAASWA